LLSASHTTCEASLFFLANKGFTMFISSRSTPQAIGRTLVLSGLVLAVSHAQAHHIWIEQAPEANNKPNATLYFGEFGDNLREASPGLLDKFVQPVARKLSAQGAQSLDLKKTANGFVISSRAARGESLVAEEPTYPLSERKDGEKTVRSLYHPAARLVADLSPHKPQLKLDLVPTGRVTSGGVELQAFYDGQPLPKAKIVFVTSSGWAREHHGDDQGKVTVSMPWRGTYTAEVKHSAGAGERVGTRGSEPYDRANYVTTLTLMQNKGLAPLPAPPAAPHNELK
jgi:uncharacterized GH25 family protein